MPKSCCAVGCSNNNVKDKKLSFHIFPMDPDRRTKWVNAVKRLYRSVVDREKRERKLREWVEGTHEQQAERKRISTR
ncbi:THAP domain-containing protein 2-like [Salarias fasciatus]|uniref:THAP domain-containing protein 2-like n=1 Tax=Salarias fasciatus TaxID=181472 RepID=UPI0011768F4D|nr:THAP domain-containing protein 2-like [Salarias fasciatus]